MSDLHPPTLFRMQRRYECDPMLAAAAQEGGFATPGDNTARLVAQLGGSLGINTAKLEFDPEATTLVEIASLMRLLDTILNTSVHEARISEIDALMNRLTAETADATKAKPKEIRKIIVDNARINGVDVDKTAESILSAPNCEGFDPENDFGLDNEDVNSFLVEVFGKEKLIAHRVLQFFRLPGFLVSYSKINDAILAKHAKLVEEYGLEELGNSSFYLFPDRESYIHGEAILEDRQPAEIKHTFRNRAMSADTKLLEPVLVADHSVENPQDFDYLAALDLTNSEKNQRYILGGIAHEVAHALLISQEEDVWRAYKVACQADEMHHGTIAVTNYSAEYYMKNDRKPNNIDGEVFLIEDFCETIRLFTTSPDFLNENSRARYNFVVKYYPWIKPLHKLNKSNT